MIIDYVVLFILTLIPALIIEKKIFNLPSEVILVSAMFLTGYCIIFSMEKRLSNTLKTISANIISRIKK